MILNPTHEITLSGLPSDVLDAYVRYKKGSRAIVTWLVQFGPITYKGVRTLPIKELAALARKVAKDITTLPDVIDFHFRETIAARKCLSKYFRENRDETEDEFDTVNHEHFTHSLNEIYKELCDKCRGSQAATRASQSKRCQGDIVKSIRNHFDCLPIEQTAAIEDALTSSDMDCRDCSDSVETTCLGTRDSIHLEDDDVAIAIENVCLLDRAQSVFDVIKDCWQKAGRGDVSFVAAAGTTNAAWQLLLKIEAQLKTSNPDCTLKSLHRRSCILQERPVNLEDRQGQATRHRLLITLEGSERSIKHFANGHRQNMAKSCISCMQKPADYIHSLDGSDEIGKHKFQIALLDNVFGLINRAGSYPSLVFNGSPCLTEVGCLLSHIQDKSCTLRCALNVHLLTISYEAFFSTCARPSVISSCRIEALRLAQQAAATVGRLLTDQHTFPCQCPQTLAFHLSTLEHDLNSYAKHKCWDLYFQSPWATGTHIIEMLDMIAYYGMRLFHYRHYVGSIVHTYNVVQQLGGLERIEPLEQICTLFEDLFFPAGGRPSTNFKNSWSRFVGARLKFKRGHKALNHRESWCMAIPPHAARAAAGFSANKTSSHCGKVDPKFDYGRYDLLIRLKQNHYRQMEQVSAVKIENRTTAEWHSTSTRMQPTTSPPQSRSPSMNSATSTTSSRTSSFSHDPDNSETTGHPLCNIAEQLHDNLNPAGFATGSSTLPTTRLNLLAIFATCTEIVSKLSDQIHTAPGEKDHTNCICYTTTLLAGADRIIEGRRLGRLECWHKSERELIEMVKSVFADVMATVEKDDGKLWLWEI